jgi:hypothetical protein
VCAAASTPCFCATNASRKIGTGFLAYDRSIDAAQEYLVIDALIGMNWWRKPCSGRWRPRLQCNRRHCSDTERAWQNPGGRPRGLRSNDTSISEMEFSRSRKKSIPVCARCARCSDKTSYVDVSRWQCQFWTKLTPKIRRNCLDCAFPRSAMMHPSRILTIKYQLRACRRGDVQAIPQESRLYSVVDAQQLYLCSCRFSFEAMGSFPSIRS